MKSKDTASLEYAEVARKCLAHLVKSRYSTPPSAVLSIDVVLWNLRAIEELSHRAGYDHIATLCHALEDRIRSMHQLFSTEGCAPWLSSIAEASEYIVDLAVCVSQGMEEPPIPHSIERAFGLAKACGKTVEVCATTPEPDPVVYRADGVVATLSGNTLQVSLPRPVSPHHEFSIIWGLERLQEESAEGVDWVVDLGNVPTLSLSLRTILMAIEVSLHRRGRSLSIVYANQTQPWPRTARSQRGRNDKAAGTVNSLAAGAAGA